MTGVIRLLLKSRMITFSFLQAQQKKMKAIAFITISSSQPVQIVLALSMHNSFLQLGSFGIIEIMLFT